MSDGQSKSAPQLTNSGARNLAPSKPAIDQDGNTFIEAIAQALRTSGARPTDAPRMAHNVVMTLESMHSGPLPPARDFAAYEQICPGAARDILEMAKEEQHQRHAMDRRDLNGAIFLNLAGIASAIVVILMMISAAVYLAMNDKTAVACTIVAGTGVASVIAAIRRMAVATPPEQKPKQQGKKGKGR